MQMASSLDSMLEALPFLADGNTINWGRYLVTVWALTICWFAGPIIFSVLSGQRRLVYKFAGAAGILYLLNLTVIGIPVAAAGYIAMCLCAAFPSVTRSFGLFKNA